MRRDDTVVRQKGTVPFCLIRGSEVSTPLGSLACSTTLCAGALVWVGKVIVQFDFGLIVRGPVPGAGVAGAICGSPVAYGGAQVRRTAAG